MGGLAINLGTYDETLEALRLFAAHSLDEVTDNLAGLLLRHRFFADPTGGYYPVAKALEILAILLRVLTADEFNHSPASREFVLPLAFSSLLGKTCDDRTLANLIAANPSGFSEPYTRSHDCLTQYNKRCSSNAIRFSIERAKTRHKATNPGAYVFNIHYLQPERIRSKDAWRRYVSAQEVAYPELALLPDTAEFTDAPTDIVGSILCSGTVLSSDSAAGFQSKTVLILPTQEGLNPDSLGFHWLGVEPPLLEDLAREKLPVLIDPAAWKMVATQSVRLSSALGSLMAAPAVGEPALSAWATAEHFGRLHETEPADIFYKLPYEKLRPLFTNGKSYSVDFTMIAFGASVLARNFQLVIGWD